jgi:transposase
MFGLTSSHRYYLYHEAADMRKGFDGLSGLVLSHLQGDPRDGGVYIFVNRRRDRMKLLLWEHTGFTLYYKRLERGTFELPHGHDPRISWETLMLMLSGISLQSIHRRKRYRRA